MTDFRDTMNRFVESEQFKALARDFVRYCLGEGWGLPGGEKQKAFTFWADWKRAATEARQYKEQAEAWEKRATSFCQQRDEKACKVAGLQGALARVERGRDEARKERDRLGAELASLRAEGIPCLTMCDKEDAIVAESLRGALGKTTEERDKACADVGREHQRYVEACVEIEDLKKQKRNMDARFSDLDRSGPARVQALEVVLADLVKQHNGLTSRIEELQQQVASLQSVRDSGYARVAELRAENDRLRAQRSEALWDRKALRDWQIAVQKAARPVHADMALWGCPLPHTGHIQRLLDLIEKGLDTSGKGEPCSKQ